MTMYRIIYKYWGDKTIRFINLNHTGLNNFVVNDYDVEILNVKPYQVKKRKG